MRDPFARWWAAASNAGRRGHWVVRGAGTSEPDVVLALVRTKLTKGSGSRAAEIAMAYKLIEAAQNRWRAVNAPTPGRACAQRRRLPQRSTAQTAGRHITPGQQPRHFPSISRRERVRGDDCGYAVHRCDPGRAPGHRRAERRMCGDNVGCSRQRAPSNRSRPPPAVRAFIRSCRFCGLPPVLRIE